MGENQMILGIKCVVYSFDCLLQNIEKIGANTSIAQYETKIRRLSQHFTIMDDNIERVVVMSNVLSTNEMKRILEILHLRQLLSEECVIGYDDATMYSANQSDESCEWMIKLLMHKLQLHSHELLFVGSENMNVCEIYDVHTKYEENPILKGTHLVFLESQVLASI